MEDVKAESDSADVKPETGDVKEDQADCDPDVDSGENEPQLADVKDNPAENAIDVKIGAEEQPKTEDAEEAEVETVIEVKASAPTVSVSWDKNEEQEEVACADDQEKTDDTEMKNVAEVEKASLPEEDVSVEESEEMEDIAIEETKDQAEDKEDDEMETANTEEKECVPMTTGEDGERDEDEKDEEPTENAKRKAESSLDFSPSKKATLINNGYCVFVGNLNNGKQYEELKTALASFFMTRSILVKDICLDKAKRHAFVDMASEMDLTKALTLNGEPLLDKPMKVYRAKVKMADQVEVKDPREVKKAKDERCLFVKNIPYTATREDLLKVFPKATRVRFLGGADTPSKGIAFVEFVNKGHAIAALQQSKKAKIQERLLHVDVIVGGHTKNNNTTQTNNTLFVSNLPYNIKEKHLRKIFAQAVKINIPQNNGKAKGFAFVEFVSVSDAEKALESSKNIKVLKRPLKVQFCVKSKTEEPKVLSKTLIVLGLDENTTAETLKEAFDGALSARINVDRDTGASRKFGFVDFESAASCRTAKESMEDCEIDGCKVTVAFARPKRPEREGSGQGTGRGRGHNFKGRGHRGGRGRGTGRPFIKKDVEQVD